MDFVAKTKARNIYVLVIMDYVMRWLEAIPLKNKCSQTVADKLCVLFTRYGIPEEVLTDCGANFLSQLLKDLYNLMGIRSLKTMPYHPHMDGMVERFNRMMKVMLKKNKAKWIGRGTKLCHLSLANTELHQMQQQD